MGPHWPGHSPTRETNESSPGVSPVPSECGLELNGVDRPNPMVGFHVLQGVEEVNYATPPDWSKPTDEDDKSAIKLGDLLSGRLADVDIGSVEAVREARERR